MGGVYDCETLFTGKRGTVHIEIQSLKGKLKNLSHLGLIVVILN